MCIPTAVVFAIIPRNKRKLSFKHAGSVYAEFIAVYIQQGISVDFQTLLSEHLSKRSVVKGIHISLIFMSQ